MLRTSAPLIGALGSITYRLSAFGGILPNMSRYSYTNYFENQVLRKRPYLKREWCVYVIENPEKAEPQEHNRYRFWARIPDLGNRYLRVITLEDKTTIHNAFPDRSFTP